MKLLPQTTLCLLVATTLAGCSGIPVGETYSKSSEEILQQEKATWKGFPVDPNILYEEFNDDCFRLITQEDLPKIVILPPPVIHFNPSIYTIISHQSLIYCSNESVPEGRIIVLDYATSPTDTRIYFVDNDFQSPNGVEDVIYFQQQKYHKNKRSNNLNYWSFADETFYFILSSLKFQEHLDCFNERRNN